jgi:hypothetical protein
MQPNLKALLTNLNEEHTPLERIPEEPLPTRN